MGVVEYDVAIVGAGPVGLALAIELSRLRLTVLVVDRRPPPDEDAALRPQLLVARHGDLANLAHLGVDIADPQLVSMIATRCGEDLSTGRSAHTEVVTPKRQRLERLPLVELAAQSPAAFLPIGRLQLALLARAEALGAQVGYGCDVVKLRRHARAVSLACADGASARAKLVVIATGARRSLATPLLGDVVTGAPQTLIAGVFAASADAGRWVRAALPVPGFRLPVRCTLLATPHEADAGTALLVDVQVPDASGGQLRYGFDAVAREHDLAGSPYHVAPQVFTTTATASTRLYVAGDGRAPVVVAGDAAQTGHVFSGQTCFVNVALALTLAAELETARSAIADATVNAPSLAHALARYERASHVGAGILAQASARHVRGRPGEPAWHWALAGLGA